MIFELQHHVATRHRLHLGLPAVQGESQRLRRSRTAIGAVADAEAEEEIEFATDNSDDDYHLPILDLPPRQHDHEAGGSSSATDPALLAILEGMRADQWRAAEEQARRDRDQATINAAMQDRQDELQRQLLTF